MSQTGIVAWDKSTPSNNGSADSAVNFAEGMAPSAVNNSARGLMASAAKYRDDTSGQLTTSGTSTAYTLTTNQVFSALSVLNGQELTVRFDQANGASPTLNVDSLGAKALQIDGSTAVPAGMIAEDSVWNLTYDNSIPAFILNGVARTVKASDVQTATLTTTGDVAIGGDISVNTDKFTVEASSGNTVIDGTLDVSDDFAVNTDKFTVDAATGNTSVGGTFSSTGAATLNNSSGVTAYNSAKAFATFTVSGTTVTSSASKRFNISSITRSGTGTYSVSFSTALPTANFIVVGIGVIDGVTVITSIAESRSTTGFTLKTASYNTQLSDPSTMDFVVFGY
jgi:hypothetical protein